MIIPLWALVVYILSAALLLYLGHVERKRYPGKCVTNGNLFVHWATYTVVAATPILNTLTALMIAHLAITTSDWWNKQL